MKLDLWLTLALGKDLRLGACLWLGRRNLSVDLTPFDWHKPGFGRWGFNRLVAAGVGPLSFNLYY